MTHIRNTYLMALAGGLVFATCATAQHAPARVHNAQPQAAAAGQDTVKSNAAQEKPSAADPKVLTIGNKAPKPALAKIFKGNTDFTGFEPGKIYVMEFWATWCGPCRAGMPHLTELQQTYADKGVQIIGVSREESEVVENFLAKPEWDKKTGYTIALDKESKTNTEYMKAAGQNGIPCAFIVGKDGYVEWIGHPIRMDQPLAKIVAGDWDRTSYKETFAREQADKKRSTALRRELFSAQRSGDNDKVLAILDRELEKNPNSLTFLAQKFELMVGPMNDPQGYEIGWKILKQNRNNSQILNAIAWYTLDDEAVKDRDLEFAMAAAKAANEASGGNDAAILDTLARAYYENGDITRAIKFQKKAAENADDGQMGDSIREVLKKYQEEAQAKTT